jgi:hypothetical protein
VAIGLIPSAQHVECACSTVPCPEVRQASRSPSTGAIASPGSESVCIETRQAQRFLFVPEVAPLSPRGHECEMARISIEIYDPNSLSSGLRDRWPR